MDLSQNQEIYEYLGYDLQSRHPLSDQRNYYWYIEDNSLYYYNSLKDWGNWKRSHENFVQEKLSGPRAIYIKADITGVVIDDSSTRKVYLAILDTEKMLKPIL